jgi:hypothetical protein
MSSMWRTSPASIGAGLAGPVADLAGAHRPDRQAPPLIGGSRLSHAAHRIPPRVGVSMPRRSGALLVARSLPSLAPDKRLR